MTNIPACLAAAILVLSSSFADAGPLREGPKSDGFVVAHSNWGHGEVSGPVRLTRLGPQVRLPGGTWEYCKRDCSETLRVLTIDFWEVQNHTDNECGIFGCLRIGYPRH